MGLDMYAYVANKAGQQDEFYDGAVYDQETKDFVNPDVVKPRELAYWRKHPNLHGWMEELWERKGKPGIAPEDAERDLDFNGIELELTRADIDNLELAIIRKTLPPTSGFFFGNESDEYYMPHDLEFVKNARAELFCGLKVFYNSSW
jgi:hypothetical protein